MAEELYTTGELARMMKCHVLTVRRRIYTGELEAFKDKRRWLVSRQAFERYQEERSRPEPPTPEVELEAPVVSELKPNQIACFFSPGGGIRKVIRDELDRAQEEIVLGIYDLTMRTLLPGAGAGPPAGVRVRILFDRTQVEGRFSKYRYLQKRGIDCRLERLERIFPHKFCVIDRRRVLTGSYNWTASAEFRNQENLVWISESGVAEGFSRKFMEYGFLDEAGDVSAGSCSSRVLVAAVVLTASPQSLRREVKLAGASGAYTEMSPHTINRMLAVVKEAATQGRVKRAVAESFGQVEGVSVQALRGRLKTHARVRIAPAEMRRLCEAPDLDTPLGHKRLSDDGWPTTCSDELQPGLTDGLY